MIKAPLKTKITLLATLLAGFAVNSLQSQDTSTNISHKEDIKKTYTESNDATLEEQINELLFKVNQIESILEKENSGHKMKSHGKENGQKGMPMQGMMGMTMSSPKSTATKMPGMQMMGRQESLPNISMQSSLPGFPGASHLYHIGSTDFFLNYKGHITLTKEQQLQLNKIREEACLEQATVQRKVDEEEQQLWKLTSVDQPDFNAIKAKIDAIEALRGSQRLKFIIAVSQAAEVLTKKQQQVLTGESTPSTEHDTH